MFMEHLFQSRSWGYSGDQKTEVPVLVEFTSWWMEENKPGETVFSAGRKIRQGKGQEVQF